MTEEEKRVVEHHVRHFDDIHFSAEFVRDREHLVHVRAFHFTWYRETLLDGTVVIDGTTFTTAPKSVELAERPSDGFVRGYERAGGHSNADLVPTFEGAHVYAHGTVKWDRCSNWHFDEQDECMLHFCDREGMAAVGEMLARCHDAAGEILGGFG